MVIGLIDLLSKNSRISDVKNIRGGTWALVHVAKLNSKPIIIKQYGDITLDNSSQSFSEELGEFVLKEIAAVKVKLRDNGIKVPTTLFAGLCAQNISINKLVSILNRKENIGNKARHWNRKYKIILLEEYVGKSFREIYRSGINKKLLDQKTTAVIEFIKKLPEGIELDTNPGNISIDSLGELYLIDFMPPMIWGYKSTQYFDKVLAKFPTYGSKLSEKEFENLKEQYTSTEGRLTRFKYHLGNTLSLPTQIKYH